MRTSKPRRLPSARPSLRSTYIIILHSRARQVNISPKNYRILCIPTFRRPFSAFTPLSAVFSKIPVFHPDSLMQKYKNIHKTALALFRHSPFCAYSPPKRPPPFYAFPAPRKTALSVGKFPTRKEYFAAVLRPLSCFSHSAAKTRSAVLCISRTSEDRLAGWEIPNPQRTPRRRFTRSPPPQRTPQKRETPRHLCHGHSPKPHSSLSATRSSPHSPRFYTHLPPKSTPFHQQNPPRQNTRFIDAILYLFHQSQYLTLPLAIFFKYSPYLLLPYCLIISFNCAFVIHLLL